MSDACAKIDNLTAAEIRVNRDRLIVECTDDSPHEIARRFVNARFDAKQRDEILSKQGAELKAAKEVIERLKQQRLIVEKAAADERSRFQNAVMVAERQHGTLRTRVKEQQDLIQILKTQIHELQSAARPPADQEPSSD
jgi:hypothetical protein